MDCDTTDQGRAAILPNYPLTYEHQQYFRRPHQTGSSSQGKHNQTRTQRTSEYQAWCSELAMLRSVLLTLHLITAVTGEGAAVGGQKGMYKATV